MHSNLSHLSYRPAFDGLRAIAIGLVMIFHARTPWLPGGNLGVDIFFVLSGYLVTHILLSEYQHTRSLVIQRFYKRRFWRLLPPLLILVILYLCLAPLLWPDYYFHVRDGLGIFLYLTDIAIVLGSWPHYLVHGWSLGIEERFYLLLPLLFITALKYVRLAYLWRFFLAIALLDTLWRWGWLLNYNETMYYRFDLRLSGLFLGAAVACLPIQTLERLRSVKPWMLSMIGSAVLYALFIEHGQVARLAVGVPIIEIATALLLIHLQLTPDSEVSHKLSNRYLIYTGKISYGLYLFHYPIMMYCSKLFSWPVTLFLGSILTFVMAGLSWRYIEHPINKWRKQRYA